MQKNELLKQFNDCNLMKLFEIPVEPNEEGESEEWEIFYINGTSEGLEAGGAANIGFLHIDKEALTVAWDDTFSLDEHLQELYEKCQDYMARIELLF